MSVGTPVRLPDVHGVLRALCALILLLTASLAAVAQPQALAARADEIKAVYLYKFVDYVEWPDSAFAAPDSPLVIGVAGADAVYAELGRVLAGRSLNGRPLAARRVAPGDAVDGVHLLFIGDPGLARSMWMQRHRDRPILIVTDAPQALELGAAINFIVVDDRLRFEASLRAAERSGLKLSSRLLALAQRVLPGT